MSPWNAKRKVVAAAAGAAVRGAAGRETPPRGRGGGEARQDRAGLHQGPSLHQGHGRTNSEARKVRLDATETGNATPGHGSPRRPGGGATAPPSCLARVPPASPAASCRWPSSRAAAAQKRRDRMRIAPAAMPAGRLTARGGLRLACAHAAVVRPPFRNHTMPVVNRIAALADEITAWRPRLPPAPRTAVRGRSHRRPRRRAAAGLRLPTRS